MKERDTDEALFQDYREKLTLINRHYDHCRYRNMGAPVSECQCDCYLKQVFLIGREAERDLFYEVPAHI